MKRSKVSKALMDKWERSEADHSKDKKEAKKRGMTMKEWEKSSMDKKMDRAGAKKMKRK